MMIGIPCVAMHVSEPNTVGMLIVNAKSPALERALQYAEIMSKRWNGYGISRASKGRHYSRDQQGSGGLAARFAPFLQQVEGKAIKRSPDQVCAQATSTPTSAISGTPRRLRAGCKRRCVPGAPRRCPAPAAAPARVRPGAALRRGFCSAC